MTIDFQPLFDALGWRTPPVVAFRDVHDLVVRFKTSAWDDLTYSVGWSLRGDVLNHSRPYNWNPPKQQLLPTLPERILEGEPRIRTTAPEPKLRALLLAIEDARLCRAAGDPGGPPMIGDFARHWLLRTWDWSPPRIHVADPRYYGAEGIIDKGRSSVFFRNVRAWEEQTGDTLPWGSDSLDPRMVCPAIHAMRARQVSHAR